MSEESVNETEEQAKAIREIDPNKKRRIDTYFRTVGAVGGSDIHLKADAIPRIRVSGELRSLKVDPLPAAEIEAMVEEMLTTEQMFDFRQHGTLDIAYALTKTERFRVNIYRQRGQTSLAARRINPEIPNYTQLHLPEVFSKIAEREQGLILMAGITGSGKSTTIAAMLEQINATKNVHIVTIEDPIEFTYSDKKALINQREIGLDCDTFEHAIRSMVREDPDVILIGEMRDKFTFQAAVQAAETGHLVFSTIHASSAPGAITRLLELFPKDQHENLRQAIAANLVAIAFQKLVPALDPAVRRVPVVEVMLASTVVKKYIVEGRENELTSVIRNEKGTGMIDFNDMLADLVVKEIISSKEAQAASPNAEELRMRMRGIKTG
ncbi:MAG TPA: PilT/PilU family type 4a pilus ATPase [Phycisphaerae bacterium]|jgi:twitching motility protein PilT|nr:PilT/PilU family type 4a pilus ATPase [Phycisphaerae bacterium]